MSDDESLSPEDILTKRHRKEKKDLQVNFRSEEIIASIMINVCRFSGPYPRSEEDR